jgi:hypothetical protein
MNLRFSLPISHLPTQAERWLNIDQMAALHGFKAAKIRCMCRKEIIPAVKVGMNWVCSEYEWNRYSRSLKPSRISTRERKTRSRTVN